MAQAHASRGKQSGSLTTRSQQQPLDLFRREFDRLFDRFLSGWPVPLGQDFSEMRVWDFGVTENDKEVVVRAELPGFDENELNVQLNENVLTIQAEKEQKGDGEEEYRRFYRSVTLPTSGDAEKVQATYANGVLELHIPRTEGSKPKRIPVQGQQVGTGRAPQQIPAVEHRKSEPDRNAGKEQGKKPSPQTAKA